MDPIERRAAANRGNIVPQVIRPPKPSAPPKSVRVAGTPGTFARQEAATTSRTGTPLPPPPPPGNPPGDDGSGQVQYGAQTVANPAPFNIDEVPIETLEKTPEYLARERAIQNQLDLFGQTQGTERTRFEEKLGESLAELGFDPTKGTFDLGELLAQGQRATVSGRAYDALRNDFAGRGMLQSGAYQARRGVLDTDLMGRKKAIEDTRIGFGEGQTAALVAQQEQAKAQRAAALDEARQALMARMGMGG